MRTPPPNAAALAACLTSAWGCAQINVDEGPGRGRIVSSIDAPPADPGGESDASVEEDASVGRPGRPRAPADSGPSGPADSGITEPVDSGPADECPQDPSKQAPGLCGCGVPDADGDGDGVADCDDGCPGDPSKQAPGQCGCGLSDADMDGNGVADCLDTPALPVVFHSRGRAMTVEQLLLNGASATRVTVAPGSVVQLRLAGRVVDSNTSCPSCITQFYARMDGVFSVCLGSSTGDFSFDEATEFTAPGEPGVYFVNPASTWEYRCVAGLAASPIFESGTVATIVVR